MSTQAAFALIVNDHGEVVALTDEQGIQFARYTYGAFGELLELRMSRLVRERAIWQRIAARQRWLILASNKCEQSIDDFASGAVPVFDDFGGIRDSVWEAAKLVRPVAGPALGGLTI